jgi:hypothetical protein
VPADGLALVLALVLADELADALALADGVGVLLAAASPPPAPDALVDGVALVEALGVALPLVLGVALALALGEATTPPVSCAC